MIYIDLPSMIAVVTCRGGAFPMDFWIFWQDPAWGVPKRFGGTDLNSWSRSAVVTDLFEIAKHV